LIFENKFAVVKNKQLNLQPEKQQK